MLCAKYTQYIKIPCFYYIFTTNIKKILKIYKNIGKILVFFKYFSKKLLKKYTGFGENIKKIDRTIWKNYFCSVKTD